jgi:hypothetical protein
MIGYGLDGQGLIRGRGIDFSPLHSVKAASGAHPVSYPLSLVRIIE